MKKTDKINHFAWFLVIVLSFSLAICLFILFSNNINFINGIPLRSVSPASPVISIAPSDTSGTEIATLLQQNKELSTALAKAQNDLKAAQSQAVSAAQLEKAKIELAAAETGLIASGTRLEDKIKYGFNVQDKYVYLTFDDGPSSNTPGVLDILKKNGIIATFFVEYNANKDYYKQIVAGGHTLALHTWSHDYADVYASDANYFKDLEKISSYVKSITGITSKIVRVPGGISNTVSKHYSKGIMSRIDKELTERGYSYFDWNAQCLDATTSGITTSQIMANIKSFTVVNGVERPFIILLLHNGESETSTRNALQTIIDYYKNLGYHFKKIDADTPTVHQIIQN